MPQGDFGYAVRVTDSVLSTTVLMHPTDAREAVKNASARFTILDPLIAPLPLSGTFPPFLGTFTIANLPTVLPANIGIGAIPVGSTAIVSNGVTAPVLGAVPGTTRAVVCEVV